MASNVKFPLAVTMLDPLERLISRVEVNETDPVPLEVISALEFDKLMPVVVLVEVTERVLLEVIVTDCRKVTPPPVVRAKLFECEMAWLIVIAPLLESPMDTVAAVMRTSSASVNPSDELSTSLPPKSITRPLVSGRRFVMPVVVMEAAESIDIVLP